MPRSKRNRPLCCRVPRCINLRGRTQFFCRECWMKLPRALSRLILDAFHARQWNVLEELQRDGAAHLTGERPWIDPAAIAAIARIDGEQHDMEDAA